MCVVLDVLEPEHVAHRGLGNYHRQVAWSTPHLGWQRVVHAEFSSDLWPESEHEFEPMFHHRHGDRQLQAPDVTVDVGQGDRRTVSEILGAKVDQPLPDTGLTHVLV